MAGLSAYMESLCRITGRVERGVTGLIGRCPAIPPAIDR